MLYPTLNQPLVLFVIFLAGLASGFLFDFSYLIKKSLKDLKAIGIFFDFIACILSFAILFITNLQINFGQFRIYIVIIFVMACLLQRAFSNQIRQFVKKIFVKVKNKKV